MMSKSRAAALSLPLLMLAGCPSGNTRPFHKEQVLAPAYSWGSCATYPGNVAMPGGSAPCLAAFNALPRNGGDGRAVYAVVYDDGKTPTWSF